MLTIKIIQDGVTSITESNSFVFYDETSREYKEMLRLADKLKEKPTTLNGIYYTQPMYGDQECKEVIREESIYCSARNNPTDKIIGMMIDFIPDDEHGDQGIEKEIAYSLIGTGDHIYVTNEQGKTVFNI
ncbi:TPA: hypothetical protein ACPGPY_000809 [Haemophilus influenzae]|uniref:hypothetical protein n=1 Tax=Haemophilus influenzae TaxID=727 RepID=UPI0005AF10F4|nr:hypothetical protein [Haemophilus influenzae]AXP38393.1 hypothetical protein CH582_07455 [Haemophilus influenzae]AXP66939.1 hypothetical protein CH576_07475 [Haemophilus influenzae]AYO35011.1 hypothetical protein CH563_05335 [Haemophilus influenzae]KIP50101.1 hypothetical protein SU59_00835 [Haemophilus influenzae]MCK8890925.1 hypothetical protein [Haemophilus influenzae]